jgi:hypothetical protein
MKRICAWCLREGMPAYLGEVEPLDDPTVTHGICGRHRLEILQELSSTERAPAAAAPAEPPRLPPDALDAPSFMTRWIADSRDVFDSLLPELLGERSNLARRAEAAERANRNLELRLAALRREATALEREHQILTERHEEIGELVASLVGRLAREVIEPLHELRAKLGRISV